MMIEQDQMRTMEPTLVTEGGTVVDWRNRCRGEDLGDDDETLAMDAATGEYYWVCLFCRGVVRPARRERA